jgi:hypothetical protein
MVPGNQQLKKGGNADIHENAVGESNVFFHVCSKLWDQKG